MKTRRQILKQWCGTGLGVMAGTSLPGAEKPALIDADAWKKQGEMFRHSGEPAGGWVQNFTSTVEPLADESWRVWSSVSVPKTEVKQIGYHTGKVGGEWKHTLAVCSAGAPDRDAELALGGLPDGWHPVQVVTLRLKDGRVRLYFWAHGKSQGVVRYLAADSEDGRAFWVVNALTPCLYHPADRAVDGTTAAEAGLKHFMKRKAAPMEGEPLATAGLISNDATNVYQLPDGSFEMYSVGLIEVGKEDRRYAAQDNIPGLVRVIDRYTSADGLNWGNRQRVLTPDERDPQDLQFYYLSVTHTERGRVGVLGHYRLDTQTIDMEVCFSADGIAWERAQRKPWVTRDKPGVAVGSCILHAPHAMVQRGGKWHLFYTGGNFTHNHKVSHGASDRAVMLATCESLWR